MASGGLVATERHRVAASLVGASGYSAGRRDTHPLVVALMIFLGAVELGGGHNLRDDRPMELA